VVNFEVLSLLKSNNLSAASKSGKVMVAPQAGASGRIPYTYTEKTSLGLTAKPLCSAPSSVPDGCQCRSAKLSADANLQVELTAELVI
jgi:hypothetical protein